MNAISKPRKKKSGGAPISDATLQPLLGYHLKRASNVIQADLARTLKPYDLRMILLSALAIIFDNPGLSQSNLADALDIERPNLGAIVDELENRKLITRTRAPNDRRVYQLEVTKTGATLLKKVLADVKEHERQLLGTLSADLISKIIDAMNTIKSSGRERTR